MTYSYNLQAGIYNCQNIPQDLFQQYGNLRYQCFEKDDPNVCMDHFRQVEFDHFDQSPHTLYILVTQRSAPSDIPTLISAVRLIPTTRDYELEMESYRYLTKGVELPKSEEIVEGNRWVGKSSNTVLGKLSTGLLLIKLYQLSQKQGFKQIIGTITTKGEAWLNKRKTSTSRNSDTYTVEKENIDILVSYIDINEELLGAAKSLLLDSIDQVSIDNIVLETNQAA